MITNREGCQHLLMVEKRPFHPGGTALRVETFEPADRCALKPKTNCAGITHDVLRWVGSGGSPIAAAHKCAGDCPCAANHGEDANDAVH